MTNTWWEYVQRIGGDNQSAIAKRMTDNGTRFTPASVNRWRASVPKPPSVTAFALAHGRPVLEAYVAAGFLTDEQAGTQVTRVDDSLSTATAAELLAELARRVPAGAYDIVSSEDESIDGVARASATQPPRPRGPEDASPHE